MNHFPLRSPFHRLAVVAVASATIAVAGCKKTVDDSTLNGNVHNALTSDASIGQEPIQSSVVNGVVTLQGNVSNDTVRLVAAEDAAKVTGVKEVVNNLSVAGASVAPTITAPAAPAQPRPATAQERQVISKHETLPPPASTAASSAPAPVQAPVHPDVTVSAGRELSVRVTEALSSASAQEGESFSGVITSPVIVDGNVAIPSGSSVSGRVTEVHDAGHFKGNSLLSVSLTSVTRHGDRIAVNTDPYTLEGKGRGKNTAEKIGGGAAVGAVLGGIFGGGKGAAIGAGAGAGGGTLLNGVTRGQQVSISSEQVIRFRLTNSITVRSAGPADHEDRERLHSR